MGDVDPKAMDAVSAHRLDVLSLAIALLVSVPALLSGCGQLARIAGARLVAPTASGGCTGES